MAMDQTTRTEIRTDEDVLTITCQHSFATRFAEERLVSRACNIQTEAAAQPGEMELPNHVPLNHDVSYNSCNPTTIVFMRPPIPYFRSTDRRDNNNNNFLRHEHERGLNALLFLLLRSLVGQR